MRLVEFLRPQQILGFGQQHADFVLALQPGLVLRVQGDDLLRPLLDVLSQFSGRGSNWASLVRASIIWSSSFARSRPWACSSWPLSLATASWASAVGANRWIMACRFAALELSGAASTAFFRQATTPTKSFRWKKHSPWAK